MFDQDRGMTDAEERYWLNEIENGNPNPVLLGNTTLLDYAKFYNKKELVNKINVMVLKRNPKKQGK
jgi:hypothetical protein